MGAPGRERGAKLCARCQGAAFCLLGKGAWPLECVPLSAAEQLRLPAGSPAQLGMHLLPLPRVFLHAPKGAAPAGIERCALIPLAPFAAPFPSPPRQLADERNLDLSHVRHFVVDECDKCLENIDMRADVQVRAARSAGSAWGPPPGARSDLESSTLRGRASPAALAAWHPTPLSPRLLSLTRAPAALPPPPPLPPAAGHLQEDPPRQAGHDVLRHPVLRDPARVQEVHARRA